MKPLFKLTEKRRNAIALLLIASQLAFYDHQVVYSYIDHISRKLLFIHTAYNCIILFAFSMIVKYGRKNPALRDAMMNLNFFCSCAIIIPLLILNFPHSDHLFIAGMIMVVVLLSIQLFIDTLIGIKKLIDP